jgi:hypothetical protein
MADFGLVVLIIAEPGLRSALAAQLTGLGENVMTLPHMPDDAAIARLARQDAVLIADKSTLEGRSPEGLVDAGWRHVAVLNGESPNPQDSRLVRLRRADALAQVTAALAEWRGVTPEE